MNPHADLRSKSFTLGVALLLAVGSFACAGRNIHRDLKADTKILTRGWTFPTHSLYDAGQRGFEYSNAVSFENTVIFGNSSTGVTSLYPGLLRVRWTFPVKNGVVSELAVDRTNVYFAAGDGNLYCLSAETGKEIWRYELKQNLASKPTLAGRRLFVTSADDTLHSLDAGTGKMLWSYKRRTPQTTTIHAASSPLVDGNEVIAGMSDGFIVAVSLEEGTLKWERKLQISQKFTDVDASPILNGDAILIPSYDGALYSLKRQGGEVLWRFDAGGARKVTLDDKTIFLPSSDGAVYALSRESGKQLWKFEIDRGTPTQITTTDRYAIFASSHQYLYVVDKETGKGLYRYNVGDGSGFSSNPLYEAKNRAIYALSMAGNLYQFKIREPNAKDPDAYRFDSAYARP
jgi:outer membrane protein assembly factor BamB